MPLTVRRTDGQRLEIFYKNGFIVDLPQWAETNSDRLIASELKLWLKQSVRRDAKEIAEAFGRRFGLKARSIRVAEFGNGWGSCGPEGNVLINWHLIFAPRQVLEYVIAHELSHLRHRSHGPQFWDFLATVMPAYERPKNWLENHQAKLSADFLIAA
jgi:predicted metal-dependent hydrolase